MQEFFELGLDNVTMEEYERRFLVVLRYVGFIQNEKVKIMWFLSRLPTYYQDKIIYDEPCTLKEAIRRDKFMYEQNKGKRDLHKAWKSRIKDKQDQRKKGSKPLDIKGNQNKYSKGQI